MRRLLMLTLPLLALAALTGFTQTGNARAQTAGASCSLATDGSGQAVCTVTASSTLSAPQTVYVAPVSYSGVAPTSCQGVTGNGYIVQATIATLPSVLSSYIGGQPGCSFQVTSGVVPSGSPLGLEIVSLPYGAGFIPQLSSYACSDPTCASTVSGLLPPAPPAPLAPVVSPQPSASPAPLLGCTSQYVISNDCP